jgi:hypothetical protein
MFAPDLFLDTRYLEEGGRMTLVDPQPVVNLFVVG